MADRTVNLVFKFAVEGKQQVDSGADSINKLKDRVKELESAQKSGAAGAQGHANWLDKLFNRITQGIPTMFTLVAAYKALQLAITLVKDSMQDLDNEFTENRKMAQSIDLYTQFVDKTGQAVSATQNFAESMKIAGLMQAYFQEQAKATNFVWEDLAKASNVFSEALRSIGASSSFIAQLTAEVAKGSVSMEDMLKKAQAIRNFAQNPRKTNLIATELGLGADDVKQIKDNGDNIMASLDVLFNHIKAQNDAMGTMPSTWAGIFHKMHEAIVNAFEDTSHIGDLQQALKDVLPYIVNLVKAITPDLVTALTSFKTQIDGLSPALFGLGQLWHALRAGVDEVNGAVQVIGANIARLMAKIIEFMAMCAKFWGLDKVSDAFMAASKSFKTFADDMNAGGEKLKDDAAKHFAQIGQTYEEFQAKMAGLGKVSSKEDMFGPVDGRVASSALAAMKGIDGLIERLRNQKPIKLIDEKGLDHALSTVQSIAKALELKGAGSEYEKKQIGLEQTMKTLDGIHDKYIRAGGSQAEFLRVMAMIGPAAAEMDSDAATALEHIAARSDAVVATLKKQLFSDDDSNLSRDLENNTRQVDAALDKIKAEIDAVNDKWHGAFGGEEELRVLEQQKAKINEIGAASVARIMSINDALKQLYSGDATAFIQRNIDQAILHSQNIVTRLREISAVVLENSNDFATGVKFGLAELLGGIDTTSKAISKLITGVGAAIHQTLADTIAGALQGDQDKIKNAFKNLMTSITNQLGEYLASSLENTLKHSLGDLNGIFSKLFAKDGSGGSGTGGGSGRSGGYWNADGSQNADSGGAGTNWLSENGGKLLGAAVGAYALIKQAKTGQLGVGEGALMGAEAGAATGSIYGVIIGAIVGAAASVFAHDDSKDPKNAGIILGGFNGGIVQGSTLNPNFTTQTEVDLMVHKAQIIFDRIQQEWLNVMLSLPDAIFKKVLDLPAPTFNFSDELLHQAVDNLDTANGSHTGQPSGTILAGGVDYQSQYQLLFDQIIPQGMANSYLPIAQGILGDLGFSEDRIKQLAARWKTLGEDFIGEFQRIIIAVASLQELVKPVTTAGMWGDAAHRANMTFGDQEHEQGSGLSRMTQMLNSGKLSEANQIDLIDRINKSAAQMFENLKNYMDSLVAVSKQVRESVNDQILGIRLDQAKKDPNKQKALLEAELDRLDLMMQSATSPEQVQALAGREQQVIGQLYQLDPEHFAETAIKDLNKVSEFVDERLNQLGDQATKEWNAIMGPVQDALTRFTQMLNAVTDAGDGNNAPAPTGVPPGPGEPQEPGGGQKGPYGGNPLPGKRFDPDGLGNYPGDEIPNGWYDPPTTEHLTATFDALTSGNEAVAASAKRTSAALDAFQVKLDNFATQNIKVVVGNGNNNTSRAMSLAGRSDAFDTGLS